MEDKKIAFSVIPMPSSIFYPLSSSEGSSTMSETAAVAIFRQYGAIAMRRVGFVLKVKPDKLAEYKQHHAQVWPDMLQALRDSGWHNYSLFVRDDGLLFGYFETPESLQ